MYIVFFLIVALASGALIAIQGVSNSVGSKLIGAPAMIAWLSVVQAIPPHSYIIRRLCMMENKVVIITGGSEGLGKGTAKVFLLNRDGM
ncbi:hypothetical protein GCM10020331_059740 [Ectobacillus funiculus]